MGYPVQQSTTTQPLLFFMTDSSDHIAGKTGLTCTVTLSKNGGSFASPSGSVSEIGNGWYKVAGNATDNATLGPLALHATATGADPSDELFTVVAYAPQDAVRLGLTALPNAAADAAGGLPISDAGGLDLDAKIGALTFTVSNKVDANVTHAAGTAWASGAITAAALAADCITAAKVADGTIDAATFATGAINAAAIATDAIDADALKADAITEFWTTALTEAYAADGAAPTPAQALCMLISMVGEFAISGTTLTCKKLDGSTTAMTFTLDDGTNPTSRTRSA